ncbi:hypothetical protein DWF00_05550 [Bosea caraganae]|uniref:Uncharacterized protein n=1 Tax=Bosea caraganae TaxID=2763117 RepID=A0A370L363_9HYPH|nr:hypothetical protein [Bosea caraganae]RDJ22833.1 hypothetical protein DWE98_16795 [Bosea caraganae]RDJ28612.1 hypothetical protein DWF00_05550 [Bosea caraganae]
MAYTDELEPLLTLEHELRQKIALRIAEESGQKGGAAPSEDQMSAADQAIEAWSEEVDYEQDPRAFRPLTPLQTMLADHNEICERIMDIRDRRLS